MDSTDINGNINTGDYPIFVRNPFYQPSHLLGHRPFDKTISRLGKIATKTSHFTHHILAHEVSIAQPITEIPRINNFTPSSDASIPFRTRLEELQKTLSRSNEVLASATTVFPLTLFRDDMIVDRTKVTINRRNFFLSSEVMSIRLEDILNVKATVGPFFGSITIAVRVMSTEDHHSVNYFWRRDAIHLKHIIQGYIIAHHNKIDCKDQDREELIKTLTQLGHDSND